MTQAPEVNVSIKDKSKIIEKLTPQVKAIMNQIYQESLKLVLDQEEELENNTLQIKVINVVENENEEEDEYYDEEDEYGDEYYDEETPEDRTLSFRQGQKFEEPIGRQPSQNS